MFCLLCKKHQTQCEGNKDEETFIQVVCTRLKLQSVNLHNCSHRSIQNEQLQRVSFFHQEVEDKKSVSREVLEKSLHAMYFIMKEHIPNCKILKLLKFTEKVMQVNDLRHFDYSGRGTLQEMFLIIGNVIKSTIQEKLRNCESIGILIDEVTDDTSVFSQLITFVEFVDPNSGKLLVNFLSVDNVLEGFDSANARALVLKSFVDSDVPFSRVTGFSSDGTSVMLGKNNGVAARLRDHNPKFINIHCVCHKLALACSDSDSEIQCIKQIQETTFWLLEVSEKLTKTNGYLFESSRKLSFNQHPTDC